MNLEFIEIPFLQLGTSGKIRTGAGFHSGDFKTEGVPLIKIGNIQNNEIDLKDCSFISEEEKKNNLTSENDLLIAMRGATSGKLGIVSKGYQGCFYVGSIGNLGKINDNLIYRPFVKYLEQQLFDILKTESKGTATPMVSIGMLEKFKLSIPKTKEQQKYLFELLESRKQDVGELSNELTFQLDLVKQLRQAFLREAMQGKLCHAETSSASQETGHDLLAKIKATLRQAQGDKKGKKQKELPQITEEEIPFEIPKHWAWCRLGEIAFDVSYGTSQKADDSSEVPLLRMGNITTDGKVLYSNLKYVASNIKDLPKLYLKNGDLVFNRTNSYELVGKCGVFKNDKPYTLASYLIRVRLFENIHSDFVSNYINSSFCRQTQIEPQIIQQNGQANFNGTKLSGIIVPLPPLHEQGQIVAKLAELMAFCDGLEQSIKESQRYNEMLLQQVLREALQG